MNVWNHVNGCDCAARMGAGATDVAFPVDPADETANPSPDPTQPEGWTLDPRSETLIYRDHDGYITRVLEPGSNEYEHQMADNGLISESAPFTEKPEIDPTPGKNGRVNLIDAVSEELPPEDGSPFRRTVLHLSGQPHIKQRVMVAKEAYQEQVSREPIDELLESNEPITVLMVGETGSVTAREGRFFKAGPGWSCAEGTPLFMEKGKRAKATTYDPAKVIDASSGYGHGAELGQRFATVMSETSPTLAKIPGSSPGQRFRDLPCGDDFNYEKSGAPDRIAAVYMIENPDFNGGKVHGCMFMATDIQRGEEPGDRDIVNGYFWAPGSSGLYSETSSMYADDLSRRGAQVRDYQPGAMSFRDCWDGMPGDRGAAYRRVINARAKGPGRTSTWSDDQASVESALAAEAADLASTFRAHGRGDSPTAASRTAYRVTSTPGGWGDADRDELPF